MDESNYFDRKRFRDEFKKLYNSYKFKFDINDNKLNNIINN